MLDGPDLPDVDGAGVRALTEEDLHEARAQLADARRGRNASSLSMIARVWWSGRLGVADEQLWPVPSLDLAAGIDSSAVALLVERARSVVPPRCSAVSASRTNPASK